MLSINLELANRIIAEAINGAQELELKPVSVVVLDAGGHVIAFQRQDGASNIRFEIALGKASGALGLGMSSRKIGEIAAERPGFVNSLGNIAPHGVVPAAGGIIIVDKANNILGAIGITGDTSDNDEKCALYAISTLNLNVLS